MGLTAALIGHSYIRRLAEDIAYEGRPKRPNFSPKMAADRMSVEALFDKVHIFGKDSFTLHQMQKNICRAGRLHPDVVVINCGSNDLCEMECDVQKVVNGLVSYANFLRIGYGVKYIAIIGVANRKKCRSISQDEFAERAYAFNGRLKAVLETVDGVDYADMKGFHRDLNGNELPVGAWSDDGVHPAASGDKRENGMEKYRKVVRRSLLKGAGSVFRQLRLNRHEDELYIISGGSFT